MNFAETQWHPFPNGRRRREIVTDRDTGQKYESYTGDVQEAGSEPLDDLGSEEFDETFEDEFEDDEKTLRLENYPSATDEELTDTSGARWLMYVSEILLDYCLSGYINLTLQDGLGALLSSKGLQGRPCVLRGICEAAETKFTHHSGLLGELFHIIFTWVNWHIFLEPAQFQIFFIQPDNIARQNRQSKPSRLHQS